MEKSYFSRQIFLAIDQMAMILYLCALTVCGYEIGAESYIHFALVFLMFADAAYVSYKNVQNNRILTNFTFWLLLSGWQFLLSLSPSNMFFYIISIAILPATLYQTIHFIQLFVFQASAYTYQKKLLRLLKTVCIISTVCYFVYHYNSLMFLYYLERFFITFCVAVLGKRCYSNCRITF